MGLRRATLTTRRFCERVRWNKLFSPRALYSERLKELDDQRDSAGFLHVLSQMRAERVSPDRHVYERALPLLVNSERFDLAKELGREYLYKPMRTDPGLLKNLAKACWLTKDTELAKRLLERASAALDDTAAQKSPYLHEALAWCARACPKDALECFFQPDPKFAEHLLAGCAEACDSELLDRAWKKCEGVQLSSAARNFYLKGLLALGREEEADRLPNADIHSLTIKVAHYAREGNVAKAEWAFLELERAKSVEGLEAQLGACVKVLSMSETSPDVRAMAFSMADRVSAALPLSEKTIRIEAERVRDRLEEALDSVCSNGGALKPSVLAGIGLACAKAENAKGMRTVAALLMTSGSMPAPVVGVLCEAHSRCGDVDAVKRLQNRTRLST